MDYIKESGYYKSTDTVNDIAYCVYTPKAKIRAIIQVSHGMCENFGRYEEFAVFMASKGILVCGNDHLGHGNSVSTLEDLGYFGEENGWRYIVRDLRTLTAMMKKQYPDVPYFLLGHSMGSFAVRAYIADFSEKIDGCILLGTNGGETIARLGEAVCRQMIKKNGSHHRSETLDKLSTGLYNERIPDNRTHLDWTTRDAAEIEKFLADERTNFIFTASGFLDLVQLLSYVTRAEWASEVPKELPILLASGDCDPVGNYGRGVMRVFEALSAEGNNAEIRLYAGMRHELLHEIGKEEIFDELYLWIEKIIARMG
ncbi:MAG: alpha/beta hydrolase [Ruminococcus sp.]|nr:alpha/beta hydrolase [Ruminococcus sp.]